MYGLEYQTLKVKQVGTRSVKDQVSRYIESLIIIGCLVVSFLCRVFDSLAYVSRSYILQFYVVVCTVVLLFFVQFNEFSVYAQADVQIL